MSDLAETFQAMKEDYRRQKAEWAARRMATLSEAYRMIDGCGVIELDEMVPGVHYHLIVRNLDLEKEWCWNLYPTTGRIYADPNWRGPFLRLPREWNFPDVVRAAQAAARRLL